MFWQFSNWNILGLLTFVTCFVQDISSPVPSIVKVGEQQWAVHFDNMCLLDKATSSYTKALESWLAVFWVFQVKFPDNLFSSCTFIEKYCLGRKVRVSGVVKRLAEKVVNWYLARLTFDLYFLLLFYYLFDKWRPTISCVIWYQIYSMMPAKDNWVEVNPGNN